MIPGEWFVGQEPIQINVGRRTTSMQVRNTGDRPVQVGSHFHFFEVNKALQFDREAAIGMRLDVPSGQSIRFEAGDERLVQLVEFGGQKLVSGFNNLFNAEVGDSSAAQRAMEQIRWLGFGNAQTAQEEN